MNRKKQFLMSFKCAHYNDNFAILRRVYLCFHIESPFPLIAEEDEDTQRLPNLCDSFKWPRLRIIFNENCEIFECSLIICDSSKRLRLKNDRCHSNQEAAVIWRSDGFSRRGRLQNLSAERWLLKESESDVKSNQVSTLHQCTMCTFWITILLYPKLPCICYRGIIEFQCKFAGFWRFPWWNR